jgi:hypothetical protein
MRKAVRWLMRLIGIVAFVVCAYVFLQAWVLPRVVKHQVASVLTGLGIADATFVVEEAGWNGVRLGQIKLGGEGAGGADVIDVSYSPWEVVGGKVRQVRVIGANLELKIHGGKVEFGALGSLDRPDRQPATRPSSAPTPLPFSQVEVRASVLKLDWEGRGILLPVNGTVRTTGGGSLDLQLSTAVQGSEVQVKGTVQTNTGDADLSIVSDRLAIAPVVGLVPEDVTGGRVSAWGTVALRINYVSAGGAGKLSASVVGKEGPVTVLAAGHRVAGDALRVTLDGTVTPKRAATLAVSADVLRIDGQPLEKVKIAVEQTDAATRGRVDWDGGEYLISRVAKLSGLSGSVEVTVPAGKNRAVVAADSRVSVNKVEPAGLGWEVEPPHTGAAAVFGLNKDAEIRWGTGGDAAWGVSVGGATVEVAAGKFTSGSTQLSGARSVLVVQGRVGPTEADVIALNGTNFSFESAQVGAGDTLLRIDATRARIDATDRPVLHARQTAAGWDLAGGVRLTGESPLAATQGQRRIDCENWAVNGDYTLGARGTFGGAGTATVRGGRYRDTTAAMDVADVEGALPVSWNAPKQPPGDLRIGTIALQGGTWPGLAAKVNFANGRVEAATDWEPITGAATHLEGWVDVLGAIKGQVAASVPPFTISQSGDVGARLRQVGDAQITGTFAIDGVVKFDGAHLDPHLTAKVGGAAVSSVSYDFALEGIDGSLEINSLTPLQTPGSQRLAVKKMRFGKLEMVDGQTQFRAESADSIFIEKVEFGWCGGRVFSNAFRIDPAHPLLDATVYADGLKVPEVLKQLPKIGDDVTGTGSLYGRLPVKISAKGAEFGDGFLYATPGVEKLSLGSGGDTVAALVADQAAKLGPQVQATLRERVKAAMRQLNYDMLRLDLRNDRDGLVAAVKVHGKGTEKGQEDDLTLNFNFRGVDKLLSQALLIKQKLQPFGEGKDK